MARLIEPQSLTVARSLPVWALETGGQVPVTVKRDEVERARRWLDEALMPARDEEFAVAIDRLFAFGRAFGLSVETAGAVGFYRSSLYEVPIWALSQMVDNVCANWKWSNRMPLPADLKEQLPEEWHRMKGVRRKLVNHLSRGYFMYG